ncbi:aminotransferase class V-fold PLP-dependent enzyme [Skermanella mucosa]|uniref:cysteine desulfurase family protein n=1 Tax=Skermanella mucosa TaxID=1789672 RepID=UPI00192AEE84|nr:aminotransferase class V-fold PLP-dependent enzyme [Skermanella mucosa]UEM19012.1 aminotransferase class V-fold PLP-dependent enzyme [Skermanella mucosa]
MIYLDNNATTMPAPEVVAAMLPYLGEIYANPSSAHGSAMAVKQAVGQARSAVAGLISAKASEIVFTSSATEANHLAILGTLRSRPDRRHVVTTAVEHPANLMLFEDLRSQGYHVTVLPVDASGRLRRHELASVVSSDTALVSVMWANNAYQTNLLFDNNIFGERRKTHHCPVLANPRKCWFSGIRNAQ